MSTLNHQTTSFKNVYLATNYTVLQNSFLKIANKLYCKIHLVQISDDSFEHHGVGGGVLQQGNVVLRLIKLWSFVVHIFHCDGNNGCSRFQQVICLGRLQTSHNNTGLVLSMAQRHIRSSFILIHITNDNCTFFIFPHWLGVNENIITLMLTEISPLSMSSLSKAITTDRTPVPELMLKFAWYLAGETKKTDY